MSLKNKYLKYTPEITFEIFTLIYNKLIENGWKSIPPKSLYDQFYSHWPYISDCRNKCFYSTLSAMNNLQETTVQEILGYDPFKKKDEFVLPEKWYIKCTDESRTCLNKWTGFTWEYVYVYFDGKSKTHSKILYDNYTEITFDQFKKYVLKEHVEQPKPIKTWTVGSYVVAINNGSARGKDYDKYFIGFIDTITHYFADKTIGLKFSSNCCNKSDFEWFATKSEAEEFAKTLIEPINNPLMGSDRIMIENLRPNNFMDKPIKKEVKHPLKQAVHCKTQEEWNFVSEKINYTFINNFNKELMNTIFIENNSCGNYSNYLNDKNYQILSFQEWCNLNGYTYESFIKMGNKDASDYVKQYGLEQLGNEIHNQILNSPKDLLIPTTGNSYNKDFSTGFIPIKPKLILSIDDEELPMVNIIKTKTIKTINLD